MSIHLVIFCNFHYPHGSKGKRYITDNISYLFFRFSIFQVLGYLTNNDKHYIDNHMEAALLLDDNLYAAAIELTPAVYDIFTVLDNFAAPIF